MALAPKRPPRALKARLLAVLAQPPVVLKHSEGRVSLEDGVVTTGPGAWAELRIKGQALIAVKENSLATIRRGAQGLELLLERGAALVNVIKGVPFSSTLPLGLVRVKGTWFYVESRGPKESYLCLCEGRIDLFANGLKKVIKSEDHVAMTVSLKRGVPFLSPAPADHWHPDVEDAS
jgi:ferric-dicitrate binding protein FerR (iron transport regulator)